MSSVGRGDLYVDSPSAGLDGLAAFKRSGFSASDYVDDIAAVRATNRLTVRGNTLLLVSGPDRRGALRQLAELLAAEDDNEEHPISVEALTHVIYGNRGVIAAAVTDRSPGASSLDERLNAAARTGSLQGWQTKTAVLDREMGFPVDGRDWQIVANIRADDTPEGSRVDLQAFALTLIGRAGRELAKNKLSASRMRLYPSASGEQRAIALVLEYTVPFQDRIRGFRRAVAETAHEMSAMTPGVVLDCTVHTEYDGSISHPPAAGVAEDTTLISGLVPARPQNLEALKKVCHGVSVELVSLVRLQRHHLVTLACRARPLGGSSDTPDDGPSPGVLVDRLTQDGYVAAQDVPPSEPADEPGRQDGLSQELHLRVDVEDRDGILHHISSTLREEFPDSNIERMISRVRPVGVYEICTLNMQIRSRSTADEIAKALAVSFGTEFRAVVTIETPNAAGDYQALSGEPFRRALSLGPFASAAPPTPTANSGT